MLCWRLTLGYSEYNTDRSILKGNARVSSPALGKKHLVKATVISLFFSFPTKLILSAVADKKIYIQFMKNLNPLNSHERSNFKIEIQSRLPFPTPTLEHKQHQTKDHFSVEL